MIDLESRYDELASVFNVNFIFYVPESISLNGELISFKTERKHHGRHFFSGLFAKN